MRPGTRCEMKDRRGEKRQQLDGSLPIYDGISSRVIGRVADLTSKGMMLFCPEPVGAQEEYRLRMTFSGPMDNRAEIIIRAVCRWCRKDVGPAPFVAGFQFQKLLPEERRVLSGLIDEVESF